MKTFYIQLDQTGVIRDILEFPHDGYIEVQMDTPLPEGINGGWYRWDAENGRPVEVPELRPADEHELEKRLADLEEALAAILGGAI